MAGVLSVGRGAEGGGPTSGPRAGHAGCALSPCRHREMERGDSQGPARQRSARMGTMKDRKGKDLTEAEKIKKK